jgi:hypothetical protein
LRLIQTGKIKIPKDQFTISSSVTEQQIPVASNNQTNTSTANPVTNLTPQQQVQHISNKLRKRREQKQSTLQISTGRTNGINI